MKCDYITHFNNEGLAEPAPGSAYAARLHLVAKRKTDTSKSVSPDGIHITWTGVEANETLDKSVATYTDEWEQLYKVANYKYKFSADGLKQYWSIPLDKDSRARCFDLFKVYFKNFQL